EGGGEGADAGQAVDGLAAGVQEVDDEDVGDQVDRGGAVAELVEQPFDAFFGAHGQGNVDLVDIPGADVVNQRLVITAHRHEALDLLQIDRVAGRVVVEAQQVQTHPRVVDDVGGGPLAQ